MTHLFLPACSQLEWARVLAQCSSQNAQADQDLEVLVCIFSLINLDVLHVYRVTEQGAAEGPESTESSSKSSTGGFVHEYTHTSLGKDP